MKRKLASLIAAVSLMSACSTPAPAPAPVPTAPLPTAPIAAKAPAAPLNCDGYADLVAQRCGWNRDDAQAQCALFNRLGDVAGCADTVRASLICSQTDLEPRQAPVTCPTKVCDPQDLALEKCLTDYCAAHATDADCAALFPK